MNQYKLLPPFLPLEEKSICLEMQADNDLKQDLPFVLTAAIGSSEPV